MSGTCGECVGESYACGERRSLEASRAGARDARAGAHGRAWERARLQGLPAGGACRVARDDTP